MEEGRRKKEEGKTKDEQNIIIFIEKVSINFEVFLFSFFLPSCCSRLRGSLKTT